MRIRTFALLLGLPLLLMGALSSDCGSARTSWSESVAHDPATRPARTRRRHPAEAAKAAAAECG